MLIFCFSPETALKHALLASMPHSWLVVFQHGYADDWLGLRLTNILVHTLGRHNCDRSGSISPLFLAALLVLAQIFALCWKQRDPLYTIFLQPAFLSHPTLATKLCYQSLLHANTHTYIDTYIHIYIHTYTHTKIHYIHTYIHTKIHYIHTYIKYIRTYIHTCMHTYTYMTVHYIHTYIYAYIQTDNNSCLPPISWFIKA